MTRWLYRIGRPNRTTTLKAHNETSGEKTLRIFDLVLAAMSVSGLPRGRTQNTRISRFQMSTSFAEPPRRPAAKTEQSTCLSAGLLPSPRSRPELGMTIRGALQLGNRTLSWRSVYVHVRFQCPAKTESRGCPFECVDRRRCSNPFVSEDFGGERCSYNRHWSCSSAAGHQPL